MTQGSLPLRPITDSNRSHPLAIASPNTPPAPAVAACAWYPPAICYGLCAGKAIQTLLEGVLSNSAKAFAIT